jgi:hypothetical protein
LPFVFEDSKEVKMQRLFKFTLIPVFILVAFLGFSFLAEEEPNEIQQPGTQPEEVGDLMSPDKCDNCHGGYDKNVEPTHLWQGSMMGNATRDPLFWATVAIAEQDFDGSGDLCLRCHTNSGWIEGRSTPTDGSSLLEIDADGVECAFCHRMTNPDDSEYIGVQIPPYEAHDGGDPPVGYYGSGMASIWHSNARHGPYDDSTSNHMSFQSKFQRDVNFCGSCHDVSNPAVGDLAHNNGALEGADPVISNGVLGGPIEEKAAFNNFPYQYGIVERTSSEFMAGLLSKTLVSDYENLPEDLKGGSIQTAYTRSLLAGTGGNYEDGTPRYFSCQTCHVPPGVGKGADKSYAPHRKDLPLHDMTGGNYWMADVIQYLDAQGKLRLGGGLSTSQVEALEDGKLRAMDQLNDALLLEVNGNILKVINRTGHKLISGFPEGRRMWLNIKWYDGGGALLREDGAYGTTTVTLNGQPVQVDTLLDLNDPNSKIYETHPGMTQEWAAQLIALGYSEDLVLSYDRITGEVEHTLGELANEPPGSYFKTFHFVLNNTVVKDNRIPPYGMDYEEARVRNALPVPDDQYGDPGPAGTYNYWDEFPLNSPPGAKTATIDMLYQPTSWEYIQFLYLANTGEIPFLAEQGEYMLEAWQNTGMAAPHVMASAEWTGEGELFVDGNTIPESTGGVINFSLIAGSGYANRNYFILGSVTGTSPGTSLPGGMATLPLNWDAFTNLVMSLWNTPIFWNFSGKLDGAGEGTAQLNTLGPLPPGSAGLKMYYAFALSSPYDFASNPVEIEIVP